MTHFQVFFNWLFDNNIKTEIPKYKEDSSGNIIIPDILKYNSPITNIYIIKIFMNNPELNYYLNETMNNINLWYLEKEDLLKFIKKCVIDFRISRNSILYVNHTKNDKLFEELKKKFPLFKPYDIQLLHDLVDVSEEGNRIYASLGIDKPIKKKISKKTVKLKSKTLKEFISGNFSIVIT